MPAETQKIYRRSDLVSDLKSYSPSDEERDFMQQFLDLLESDRCFYRDHFDPGHITGSAILINKDGNKILMNHHKFLNKWLNFGGHCDGEEDVLNVAIRETMEESGLSAFRPLSVSLVDLDIHAIPANHKKGEPEHLHFDIRYAMQMTDNQSPVQSIESHDLRWMSFDEALAITDHSLRRLIQKVQHAEF